MINKSPHARRRTEVKESCRCAGCKLANITALEDGLEDPLRNIVPRSIYGRQPFTTIYKNDPAQFSPCLPML